MNGLLNMLNLQPNGLNQQLQAQGGQITPPSPMDQLNQSMMNSQAMQAQAGLPQAAYSPQMSMGQAPNQAPVNPMGNPSGLSMQQIMEAIAGIDPDVFKAPDAPASPTAAAAPPAMIANNAGNVLVSQPTPWQPRSSTGIADSLGSLKDIFGGMK